MSNNSKTQQNCGVETQANNIKTLAKRTTGSLLKPRQTGDTATFNKNPSNQGLKQQQLNKNPQEPRQTSKTANEQQDR